MEESFGLQVVQELKALQNHKDCKGIEASSRRARGMNGVAEVSCKGFN
jgi:hypothetical protein